MPQRGIWPRKDSDTDEYFRDAHGHLTKHKIRLLVDATKLSKMDALMGGSRSFTATPPNTNGQPHTWNYVFPLEKNEDTFTHPLQKEKESLKKEIKLALLNIYGDIPDNKILPADTLVLHIRRKSDRKGRRNAPPLITEGMMITLEVLGGQRMRVIIRPPSHKGKAAKLNEDVQIELAYSAVPPGKKLPVSFKHCDVFKVVPEARWILDFEPEQEGYKLALFARWVYISHPDKSGAFNSSPATITIS